MYLPKQHEFQERLLQSTYLQTTYLQSDILVERRRHVAAVYVVIVNCWTSHGRRTFMTMFRSVCADLPQVNTENA